MKLFKPLLLSSIFLSACTTLQNATPDGLFVPNYSQPAADLKNELILLNIARAANFQPMHFVRITGITNSSTVNATAGFGASIPERGLSFSDTVNATGQLASAVENVSSSARTFTPSIGGGVTFNPVINYEILDSKEFYNGILTPLSDERYAYFYNQGWHEDMLEMLLIEKMTLNIPGYEPKPIHNDPNDSGEISEFRKFVACLRTSPGTKTTSKANFSYDVKKEGFSTKDIKQISEVLDKTGWSVLEKEKQFVRTTGGGVGVSVNYENCTKYLTTIGASTVTPKDGSTVNQYLAIANESGAERSSKEEDDKEESKKPKIEIIFRSTHGVIYYMGECVREARRKSKNQNPIYPCFYDDGAKKKYISYIQDDSHNPFPPNALLATKLNDRQYYIPKNVENKMGNQPAGKDRTFAAISFIDQLLSLQQEESDSPTPTTIIGLSP